MDIELMDFMEHVARKAGSIIMEHYGLNIGMAIKNDGTRVTDADKHVSEYVHKVISRIFPDAGLLTEEAKDSEKRLSAKTVFIVDEIDGTSLFVNRRQGFHFLLGCVEEGKPIAGVAYDPLGNCMFLGEKGKGACISDDTGTYGIEPLRPVDVNNIVVGASSNHSRLMNDSFYQKLGVDYSRVKMFRSASSMLVSVMRQDSNLVVDLERTLHEWDVAAGHAILEEMGVSVTDIYGNSLLYNQKKPVLDKGFLAVHPGVKQETLYTLSAIRK